MHLLCSASGIRSKYGSSAPPILAAIGKLGTLHDVSGLAPEQTQAKIAKLSAGPAALIGGYDLIAPFVRPNPTFGTQDDDATIPTDAPYGAAPGKPAQEYAPTRAVSRIPDSANADAHEFLALLEHQAAAVSAATPSGSYQEAAKEFAGALKFVGMRIPTAKGPRHLSPPGHVTDSGLAAKITGKGRIHILLHGANSDPDWAFLWGHDGAKNSPFIKALSAPLLDLCDLRGAMVTFSSCYSAMLDAAPAVTGARVSKNQVALACLTHGAKAVFGSTRSNWIGLTAPFDDFGPGLTGEVWSQLAKGVPAAQALCNAKAAYLKKALSGSPGDRPYALKTVLQAQCYGHPAARL